MYCVTDLSVADGKSSSRLSFSLPNTEDGAGRLLRLDSSVDMKLGDLGGMSLSDAFDSVQYFGVLENLCQVCSSYIEMCHTMSHF